MVAAAVVILDAGRDLSFTGDEPYYYARLVDHAGSRLHYDAASAEYLLAPHNGHLQLVGKLIYEAVFAVAGPNYAVFRVIVLAGILLCVGLFFALAHPRLGAAPALAAAVLLLFMGAAWESMLWAFNLHTVYALAAGLGAMLMLDRGSRAADAAACVLLLVAVTTLELGLAFVGGAALLIAVGRDRVSRAWIVLVPLAFYAIWWIWARRFDQTELLLSNLPGVPGSMFESLTAVLASLTGRLETVPDAFPSLVAPTGLATVLAVIAIGALVLALARPGAWRQVVPWLGVLLAYWAFIGLADRPPDSSRYVLAGATLLLLTGAAAVPKSWHPAAVTAILAVACAVSLPNGLAKLSDGRASQLLESQASRAEYAMLELARDHVSEGLSPAANPVVRAAGPVPSFSLDAATYFDAAERVGSLAYSLEEVRALEEPYRRGADATLAVALALSLERSPPPADSSSCRVGGGGEDVGSSDLPRGGALIASAASAEVEIGLSRFAHSGPSVTVGTVPAAGWTRLQIPGDAAPDPWRLYADEPVRICSRR